MWHDHFVRDPRHRHGHYGSHASCRIWTIWVGTPNSLKRFLLCFRVPQSHLASKEVSKSLEICIMKHRIMKSYECTQLNGSIMRMSLDTAIAYNHDSLNHFDLREQKLELQGWFDLSQPEWFRRETGTFNSKFNSWTRHFSAPSLLTVGWKVAGWRYPGRAQHEVAGCLYLRFSFSDMNKLLLLFVIILIIFVVHHSYFASIVCYLSYSRTPSAVCMRRDLVPQVSGI